MDRRDDERRLHSGEFPPRTQVNVVHSAPADIQNGSVDEVRSVVEASEKLIGGEIQLVYVVDLWKSRQIERKC